MIELWSLDNCGLILPREGGLKWSNQCGGISCNHPEIEGIYIPLPLNEIRDKWFTDCFDLPYDEYFYSAPGLLIDNDPLGQFLRPLSKEEFNSLGIRAMEAWVPYKIKKVEKDTLSWKNDYLNDLDGETVILTYLNSD